MSSASREHVHQLGTTQVETETSITSMASTTQPDDTAPASQSDPAQGKHQPTPPPTKEIPGNPHPPHTPRTQPRQNQNPRGHPPTPKPKPE
ncbi:unnamed protein product [Coregonus sp. 'balchen']|nr:unnamed protein product [Coregonus sp. 'balchen']